MTETHAQPPAGIAALLGRTALVMIGISIAGIVLTAALRVAGASDTVIFVVAALTLAGLAGWDPLESTCRHASLSIL